jgi:pyocin large subunit-like protein
MSPWALLRAVLKPDSDLKPSERLVLLSLAQHGDEAGVSHPSVTRLAACTGLNRETVIIAVRHLEELGLLVSAGVN